MKNNFIKHIYTFVFVIFLAAGVVSCSKETVEPQIELSYKMLSNKTWFLDYIETINGSTIKTKSYIGQPTYFINFLKDNTTLDSDGIVGTYSVEVVNGKTLVKVNAKTIGGTQVAYDYKVESIGAKVLVLSYVSNGITNKLYYSAK